MRVGNRHQLTSIHVPMPQHLLGATQCNRPVLPVLHLNSVLDEQDRLLPMGSGVLNLATGDIDLLASPCGPLDLAFLGFGGERFYLGSFYSDTSCFTLLRALRISPLALLYLMKTLATFSSS